MAVNLLKSVFGWVRSSAQKPPGRVPRLTKLDFDLLQSPRALLVDLRLPVAFSNGFIPGSVNVPDFESPWLLETAGLVGERSIYLVADSEHPVERAARFFERVDYMQIAGCFPPTAIEDWRKMHRDTGTIEYITADTLAIRLAAWKTIVADIRAPEVFRKAHVPEAILVPLNNLVGAMEGLPRETSLSLICEMGKLCTFAASLLWNAGYRKLAIVKGGYAAYVELGLPLTGV